MAQQGQKRAVEQQADQKPVTLRQKALFSPHGPSNEKRTRTAAVVNCLLLLSTLSHAVVVSLVRCSALNTPPGKTACLRLLLKLV